MNLSSLKISKQIVTKNLSDVELLKSKIKEALNSNNFRTGTEPGGISFSKKIKIIYQSTENRAELLKVFREGEVIIKSGNNKVRVIWIIKLGNLYFLSALIGIALSILTYSLINPELLVIIIVGLIGFSISILIGVLKILSKVSEITNSIGIQ